MICTSSHYIHSNCIYLFFFFFLCFFFFTFHHFLLFVTIEPTMIGTILTENFNNITTSSYVVYKLCLLSLVLSLFNIIIFMYCLLTHNYCCVIIWILLKTLYWNKQIIFKKRDTWFCIVNDVIMIIMVCIRLLELHNIGITITVNIRLKLCYLFADKIKFETYPLSLRFMLWTDYKMHADKESKHFLTIQPHITYLQKFPKKYIKKYEQQQHIMKENIEKKITKRINKDLKLAKISEHLLKYINFIVPGIDIVLKGSTSVLLTSITQLLWEPTDIDCDLLCGIDITSEQIRNMVEIFDIFIDKVYDALPKTITIQNNKYTKSNGKRIKLTYTHISGICNNFYGKKNKLSIYCLIHLSLPQSYQKFTLGRWALFNLLRIKAIYTCKNQLYYYPEILDLSTLHTNDPKYTQYSTDIKNDLYYSKHIIYYPTIEKYCEEMLRMINSPRGTPKEPQYRCRIQLCKDYKQIMFFIISYTGNAM